jgi:hypothetical protein
MAAPEPARSPGGWVDGTREAASDALTTFAGVMTSPDGVPIAAVLPAYNGPITYGEAAIQPLRDLGPVADQVEPMAYTQLQTMLDEGFPPGCRCTGDRTS